MNASPSDAGTPPAVAEPCIRSGFARADDGVRLYWRAVGQGPILICNNGVGVSTYFWRYFVEFFARDYTVVVWDYRAHGRSDRVDDWQTADMSIERFAADLDAVVGDVAGEAPIVLVGHSMGCQVLFEYYRTHADRVSAIVPMLGSAGRTLETFFDYSGSPRIFEIASRLVDRRGAGAHSIMRPLLRSPLAWFVTWRFDLVDPVYARREDMVKYLGHISRLDLRVFLHNVLEVQKHDAWDVLPRIAVPALIVAAERDAFTPMWLSRKIVKTIPGAELLVLADASHAALIEQPENIHHRVQRFLNQRVNGFARP
ncbi:MAG: alpha/beta hydrolase [Myxococcales bacterium]|nr:alpha/beta hydrolase [Myxococcales bacterium]